MISRLAFALIAGFWITMNVLLWRTEYGSRDSVETKVPAILVWRKILTAPDASSLNVVRNGKRIGFGHWITGVSEEWANVDEESLPPGTPLKAQRFQLHFDGNAMIVELTNRVRVEFNLTLDADRAWRNFDLRLNWRPTSLEIRGSQAEKKIHLTAREGEASIEQEFKFSDLQNPSALLGKLSGPLALPLLNEAAIGSSQSRIGRVAPGLNWSAVEDSMRIGRSDVRAYRLEARILEKYTIRVYVSRVGEILRVELPGGVTLLNDQLFVL